MSTTTKPPAEQLETEFTAAEVAASFKRSTRWLKDRIKRDQLEHTRHGDKITFTIAQVEAIRALDRVQPTAAPVTTGRKRS